MIRVGEGAAVSAASPGEKAGAQATFRERHHLRIPGFLEATLLSRLQTQLRTATFVPKRHGDIGEELVCWHGPAADSLLFVFNDPRLFELVSDLTGIGPIGCFAGRVYRMQAGAAHHEMWHSDVGDHRLIAVSVNLSEEPYRGGTLILREQDRPDTEQRLPNTGPGDAVLFRIDPALEHCLTDVEPGPPKTAWAGWFRSEPSFRELLAGRHLRAT